ncbi:YgjV family protein [Vibrio astriarenae]|uniref:YgjV family protein n=1 Tax=Vibrio agarivorans TaxID=153622 RepID=UPI00222EDC9B|nr:YgjV family protein [Vibrio agarivorans]MDN3660694.1 YgjV family protein [Vibrio agarivorans]
MDNAFIAQILGFVSLALGIFTFYQKDDRKLKVLMLFFHINHLIHYFLLGSLVSVASSALSALRTATSIYVSSLVVASGFIAISAVSGYFLMESVHDIWPLLGTAIGTYSVFCLKGIAMRLGFLVGACCWLINNIIVGSIGGTMLEMTLITVNLSTTFRLIADQRKAKAAANRQENNTPCLYTTKTSH